MASYADILEKAADILESERVDWCQGTYFRPARISGSLHSHVDRPPISACALGAIRMAAVGENASYAELTTYAPGWLEQLQGELDDILRTYLDKNMPLPEGLSIPDWGGIASFNDTEGRTKAEVIEVFKQVAKDLRNATNE